MEGSGLIDASEARAARRARDASEASTAPVGLAAFTAIGVEIEYMIVDRAGLDVRPIADLVLQRLRGEAGPTAAEVPRGNVAWSNELVLHLLELKNQRPTPHLAALASRFQAEIRAVQAVLHEFSARLMPGGMHPWMDPRVEAELWPHDGQSIYNAYDRIFDCRRHGWANVQAMHVNLPFADDAEFERLHAAVRVVLPIVPAIAASSPFVDGHVAPALDTRIEVYRTNADKVPALTGLVVPENYSSRAQYETALLAPIFDAIAAHDPDGLLRHEWLNARGAIARFDRQAIEIRVTDVQEHPAVDVALAALLADVAWWLYREESAPLAAQQALDTARLAGVLQACARDGERATVDYAPLLALYGVRAERCTAAALWQRIAEGLERAGAPNGPVWRAALQRILTHGPLARRLLAAAGPDADRAALTDVYRELADCLEDGRDFAP